MLAAILAAQIQVLSLGACPEGATKPCSIPGCALAVSECNGINFGPCYCEIQTCDDGNPCTTDGVTSGGCTHTLRSPGSTCSDANACTTNDQCDAAGHCVGTPAITDDGSPCTLDRCDAATGAITHTAVSSADCSSGTYFCYDKYGNVTRKIVCVSGVSCDTSCP